MGDAPCTLAALGLTLLLVIGDWRRSLLFMTNRTLDTNKDQFAWVPSHLRSIRALSWPDPHQRFRLVPAVKLLGIMLRNRCWLSLFHIVTTGDADR
jgi:hypothetical protein